MIAEERARQVSVEGWSAGHDDEHRMGEMAVAAICYAKPHSNAKPCLCASRREASLICPLHSGGAWAPAGWPWSMHWWKPSESRVRNLVKAGALIAAEIDRLNRAAAMQKGVRG